MLVKTNEKGLSTSSPIQTILSVLELHQSQLPKKQIVDFNHRSGIAPCPEDERIFSYNFYFTMNKYFRKPFCIFFHVSAFLYKQTKNQKNIWFQFVTMEYWLTTILLMIDFLLSEFYVQYF